MTAALLQPLPAPPSGFRFYETPQEVLRCPDLLAYQHLVLKAWTDLKLSAVLTLNGIPTVYVSDSSKPLSPSQAAEYQLKFWNQGLATVLLLRDAQKIRVFSAMRKPLDPAKANADAVEKSLVESLDLATQAAWASNFYLQLGTGQYYTKPEHRDKFDAASTVDAYLLNNLERVRGELVSGPDALSAPVAHAFLGRILFTCYLCHRGIIKLGNYIPGSHAPDLLGILRSSSSEAAAAVLYKKLFPKLKREFNSSMFDESLDTESALIRPRHIDAIRHFLEGSEVSTGQRVLGFAAYQFAYIPVETISSVYEKFLDHEDEESKRELGAYYTPRLLAEMTLDLALRDRPQLSQLRFIDPACGSGIFLVLIFNRLVAEWRRTSKRKSSVPEKAAALLDRLGRLRGVDRNLTACRITCFSLYLAFLDQFDPADVRKYVEETGNKLPNLLHSPGTKNPDIPVVWLRDFTTLESDWQEPFDIVVGNPPWVGRGSKQVAHRFMEDASKFLKPDGAATFILPTKVFFNQTDSFQKEWLKQVTLETVIQLADYRFILFKGAICPSVIARFTPQAPEAEHAVEYIAPKVTLSDLRDGLISVESNDRKWIPLQRLLAAAEQGAIGMAWKTQLWGTPKDQKLLNYLFTLPRLGAITHQLRGRSDNNSGKRWIVGQGCKPWKKNSKKDPDRKLRAFVERRVNTANWSDDDLMVVPDDIESAAYKDGSLLQCLGDYFSDQGYVAHKLYSKPPEALFTPPLVLVNQGFSSAAFFDYPTRFQHSLQSFAGPTEDAPLLQFLAAYLTSKLARYFAFHTSANIGTERDKVHLDEVLRFPFFPPEIAPDPIKAQSTLKSISKRFETYTSAVKKSAAKLIGKIERKRDSLGPLFDHDGDDTIAEIRRAWKNEQQALTLKLRLDLDPLVYAYFGLSDEEIILVEETCDIFDRSDTPGSLASAANIPTLQPLEVGDGFKTYAKTICQSLNARVTGEIRVVASGMVHAQTGLALIELAQSRTESGFKPLPASYRIFDAASKLQKACIDRLGGTLEFHRAGWFFEGKKIYILKPARLGEWTRTAALNDAAELREHIQTARRAV